MDTLFLNRIEVGASGRRVDVLVVFVSSDRLDHPAFVSDVERELEQRLEPDELLVLCRESSFQEFSDSFSKARELTDLLDRFKSRATVSLVAYDAGGAESRRQRLVVGPLSSEVSLSEIARRGVSSIFRERGGFVESTSSYHFEGPSGRHTNRFMRLSNILVRQAEINFIAFCLLPFISNRAEQVSIDTPALYAVVSAINEQWRTLAPLRRSLSADNFRSYYGLDGHSFTNIEISEVLISASSSGGLARKLELFGFALDQITHVLFLGDHDPKLQIACDLAFDGDINPTGQSGERIVFERADCELCAADSLAIVLRGDQFDVAGPQPEPVLINKSDAPTGLSALMARIVGTDVVSVGLANQPGVLRQYQINVAGLMQSSAFLGRLQYYVSRHIPASVQHCIAIDGESVLLAEAISRLCGGRISVYPRTAIDEIPKQPNRPDGVLIVGAVIESGRVLLDVSRDLRNIFPEAPLIYFVGVSKSESTRQRERQTRTLVQTDRPAQHLYVAVEDMLLPPATGPNSWRQELDFLRDPTLSKFVEGSEYLRARQRRLMLASKPLRNELFLVNEQGSALRLQLGFVFWPDKLPEKQHSQADVYFTVSSVLQNMRSNSERGSTQSLRSNWFQQSLISPENFGRFNDGIIQASLLRAARPVEMDYSSDARSSASAGRIVRRILESAAVPRGEAAAEFLISLGTGRMKLMDEDLSKVFQPIINAPKNVADLAEICRHKLGLLAT